MLSRSSSWFSHAKKSVCISTVALLSLIPGYTAAATTEISGLLEGELGFVSADEGSSSDIVLATLEIGIDAEISEWFGGHVVLLHEEVNEGVPHLHSRGETGILVDESYIEFGNSFLSSFSVQFGHIYIPFGNYESNLISDPLTLEIGETRESALILSYDSDLYFSFYLFNGDLNEAGGDDALDNVGINFGYAFEGESISFDVGGGYINNIKESNGFSNAILDYRDEANEVAPGSFPAPEEVDAYVAGFTGHFIMTWGGLTFIGEMVAALDDFDSDELATAKRKPSAGNLEFAYNISDDFVVAMAFQNTVDMEGYLPESRFLLGLSYQIDEATSFAFEFAADSDYSDGDTGDATITTMQLATEF